MRGKKLNDRITTYRISLVIYNTSFESPNTVLNPDNTPGFSRHGFIIYLRI